MEILAALAADAGTANVATVTLGGTLSTFGGATMINSAR